MKEEQTQETRGADPAMDLLNHGTLMPEMYRDNGYMELLPKAQRTEMRRLLIGLPVTGLVRVEFMFAKEAVVIPTNWSHAQCPYAIHDHTVGPLGYDVKDARNYIVQAAVTQGYEWCFRPETLIETQDGAKPIRDISVGDLVKTHLGRLQPVLAVCKRRYPQRQPLIWVRTEHSTIKCTPEHPFYVERAGQRAFIQAQDLLLTDRLLYPSAPSGKDTLDFHIRFNTIGHDGDGRRGSVKNGQELGSVEVTKALARFLGLYLAEGCGGDSGITFTFHNDETSFIEHVCAVSQTLFGRKPNIRTRWATNVTINVRALDPLFRSWFGDKAPQKRVPEFVFTWGLANRLAFLQGYLEGDGHCQKGGGNACSSASHALIEGIQRLAQSCGLATSTVWRIPPSHTIVNGQDIQSSGGFMLRLGTKSWGKLCDLLDAEEHEHMLHIPLVALEQHLVSASLRDEYVYNLDVAEDHSYIADCAAVHNCFFLDHDVIVPPDLFIKMNAYMQDGTIPIVSGLYTTKSDPAEPLVYRGRGNSYYRDWKLGDKVWVDGTGCGCLLLSVKLLKAMWEDAPSYIAAGQYQLKRVFETPSFQFVDPEAGTYRAFGGTEDLSFFDRVREGSYLKKTGFTEVAKKKWFICMDSSIFCMHIDQSGVKYPKTLKW